MAKKGEARDTKNSILYILYYLQGSCPRVLQIKSQTLMVMITERVSCGADPDNIPVHVSAGAVFIWLQHGDK